MSENPRPRVSVLLPAYNEPVLVHRAISSVLEQTYTDYELLVVDDGSRQETARALQRWVAHPRVRVLTNAANLGLPGTLNRGLRECRGSLVARIDQDDWCAPTRLERQVAVFDANPATVLCATGYIRVSPTGSHVATISPPLTHAALAAGMLAGNRLPHSGVMYSRDAALSVGGYDEAWYPAEDYDLWLRLLQVGEYRGVASAEVYYSHNPEGISRTRAEEQAERARLRAARYRAGLLGDAHPAAGNASLREFDRCARAISHQLASRGIDTAGVHDSTWRAARAVASSSPHLSTNLWLAHVAPKLSLRRLVQKSRRLRAQRPPGTRVRRPGS